MVSLWYRQARMYNYYSFFRRAEALLQAVYDVLKLLIITQNYMKKLKIALVVHGRFHAFDLARELIKQGDELTLFTNYPKYFVEKFGIPKTQVRSFLFHGIISRIINFCHQYLGLPNFEPFLHSWFSRWVVKQLIKDNLKYDVCHVFSGVAEELFSFLKIHNHILITLIRGSAHIKTQSDILISEEKRAGIKIDRPSDWMINREEREYQLADIIFSLSTFAKKSFIEHGVNQEKLKLLPLGTQLSLFRPNPEIINQRCERILSNQPLRVLMVGNFSLQKGAIDFINIVKSVQDDFKFRFVGTVTNEVKEMADQSQDKIEFLPRVPQFKLPSEYTWADIFIFTTIHDGYAVVLSQAVASGLPIIATPNSSAPDIIIEDKTGWIVPIRSPEKFVERLEWCHNHRQELADMVHQVYDNFQPRDWSNVAADFHNICAELILIRENTQL